MADLLTMARARVLAQGQVRYGGRVYADRRLVGHAGETVRVRRSDVRHGLWVYDEADGHTLCLATATITAQAHTIHTCRAQVSVAQEA